MADDKKSKGGKPAGGAPQGKAAPKGGATQARGRQRAAKGEGPVAAAQPRPKDYKPRLKEHFEKVLRGVMTEKFGYKNHMQVPRLEKIVLNMGVGEAVNDRKKVDSAANDLSRIAGQRPVITRARKSIATFKVRDGMALGTKVTLRGDRMYEFLDRFVTIAMPRIKDFRGLNPKSFDGRGNYAVGLKEHIIFPEIEYDQVDEVLGMDVVICTTAETDDEARELLRGFKLPFRN